jgi:hypothetical protein
MARPRLSHILPLLLVPALIGCGRSGDAPAPPPPPLSDAAMKAVVEDPGTIAKAWPARSTRCSPMRQLRRPAR